MSSLARVVLQMGCAVTGSDLALNRRTEALAREGAAIYQGHRAANVAASDLVVASDAIPEDNPELRSARSQGLKVLRRGEMLAWVCAGKRIVAVAGSHGKTTTCAMTAHILDSAGLDPTVVIGGAIDEMATGGRLGAGDVAIVEACEAFNAILQISPEVGVITSLDPDHLDFHGSFEALKASFVEFGRSSASIVGNIDDASVAEVISQTGGRTTTYGQSDADYVVSGLEVGPHGTRFSLKTPDAAPLSCEIAAPGRHVALNAAAAIASCSLLGVSPADASSCLRDFESPARRFEVLEEFAGVLIVDDYAHHPREVAELIAAARGFAPGRRLIAVFQPHMYSRTLHMMDDFAETLAGADRVLVVETYPARELRKRDEDKLTPEERDSARVLASAVGARAPHLEAEYAPSLESGAQRLTEIVRPGDLVLTIGAGDIDTVARALSAQLEGRKQRVVR
jgi:UDP-N-acetylmuramate--alanine ligase